MMKCHHCKQTIVVQDGTQRVFIQGMIARNTGWHQTGGRALEFHSDCFEEIAGGGYLQMLMERKNHQAAPVVKCPYCVQTMSPDASGHYVCSVCDRSWW